MGFSDKGYTQLAIRSGYYADIDVSVVREGEYKGRDKATGKPIFEFIEDDAIAESKPIIGYRAYFIMLNGFTKTVYWSKSKVESHRDRFSKAAKFDGATNQWRDNFDGMALKTVLRQLISKWGIMSVEMLAAVEKDQAVIKEDGTPDYVDNPANDLDDGSIVADSPKEEKPLAKEPIKEAVKSSPKPAIQTELPFPDLATEKDDDSPF